MKKHLYLFSADLPRSCSAGFQTCCIADFQVGSAALRPAGLETRDTADLEVCATLNRYKHLIAFGTLFLFAAAGLAASAQDAPAASSVEARLAARRAAEEIGATAAPAAPAEPAAEPRITPIPPIPPMPPIPPIAANLQLVWQRNVFDRARVPYTPRTYHPPPVIETFSLRGISEIVGKELVALFGGNGVPSYPPACVVGDLLGGDNGRQFKITAITLSNVTLLDTKFTPRPVGTSAAGRTNSAPAGPEFVLDLDEQLTRADGGPWTTNAYIPVYPTFAARNPIDSTTMSSTPAPFPTPMNPRVPRSGPSVPGGPIVPTRRVPRAGGSGRGGVPGFAAPAAVTTPAAAPDPIVLASLQSQRNVE